MSESLKDQINIAKLPKHIAIVMDGNGRWAKEQNRPRVFGHRNGVQAVREVTEAGAELGLEHLTLYAFSTENWNRPKKEVNALMHLLVQTIKKEIKTLNKNNIKLNAIGDLKKLPTQTYEALMYGIEATSNNTRMTLNLALNYSGRSEITSAMVKISDKMTSGEIKSSEITEDLVSKHLYTDGIPDPELLIRTSGEQRISNFLLWQLAYTELCFLDIYWPQFKKENLYEAILDFQHREKIRKDNRTDH